MLSAAEINEIRRSLRQQKPLVHSITNPISINQCANAILAVGAKAIMAEHPCEVAEITETAKALLLNIGNLTDARMCSAAISSKVAKEKKIPSVLDVVGVACLKSRRAFAKKLIEKACPDIIKGNYSEIKALFHGEYHSEGIDSENSDTDEISLIAAKLAQQYQTVILASGKTDIITDGRKIAFSKNGCEQLTTVTGTGCMLGALCACYLSVCDSFTAATAACTVLGVCGELSMTEKGSGSFLLNLMDNLSTLTDKDVTEKTRVEVRKIEKL